VRRAKSLIAALGGGVGRSAERKVSRSGLAVLCALGVAVGHATISRADNVCNGFINFSYPVPPNPPPGQHNVGDTVTVQFDLGAGTITGGPANILMLTSIRVDLACKTPPLPVPGCPSEPVPVMMYTHNSFTSNCPGITFTDSGSSTTDVTFTASPTLDIPALTATPPGKCFLQITETIVAPSTNPDGFITQVVSYDQAQCDNGLLDSGGFQTGQVSVVVPTVDFDCYEADSTFSSPGHTLTDVFGTFTNVTVGSSQRICAPARKVTDPDQTLGTEHLVAYSVKQNLKRNVKGVSVNSPQFGPFVVDVTKVAGKAALMVPSFKTVQPSPPPPQDTNPKNHFLCYDFDVVSGGVPGPVMVRDQFNPNPPGTKPPQTVTFTKQKSWRLCVPVDKDGLDPDAPKPPISGLLCLVTGPDIDSPLKNTFVNWANQFQNPAQKVHIDKLDDFCVTAIVTP
jgi:hypothetical protein